MSNVYRLSPAAHPRSPEAESATRQDIVRSLYEALTGAINGMRNIPIFVRECFESRVWEQERTFSSGTVQKPIPFREFVHAPYPVGLSSNYQTVRQFLVRDAVTLALWDAATKREAGGSNNPAGLGGPTGKTEPDVNVDNIHVDTPDRDRRPTGTSAQTAIRRLRKDADSGDAKASELLDRVTSGEIKPHAAAVEMGYRPKTITVREDSAALFAALMKVASASEIALMAIAACDDDGIAEIFAGLGPLLARRR